VPALAFRTRLPLALLMKRAVSVRVTTNIKGFFPLTAAALLLAGGALVLTGCQSASVLNRTVDVAPVTETASGRSAGLELHLGDVAFGINCATDSVGDGTRGTAALMCTWRTPR
jgi:hypothetical protein